MQVVVGITGASGSVYAQRLFALLQQVSGATRPEELVTHVVCSANAPAVWRHELSEDLSEELASYRGLRLWSRTDFSAPFASGSNAADATVLIPCSMSALARVAHGGGDDLIGRACEVALKERRKLILVVRETPLSLVHLRNMVAATEAGALILPAIPSFYSGVATLHQAVDTVVTRVLDQIGLKIEGTKRWGAQEP